MIYSMGIKYSAQIILKSNNNIAYLQDTVNRDSIFLQDTWIQHGYKLKQEIWLCIK